jgi:hypothetical protein
MDESQSMPPKSNACPSKVDEREHTTLPATLSIPQAGKHYFGLSTNGSYDAAERGEIPYFTVGRLKRVSTKLMEKIMAEGPAALEEARAAAALMRLKAETSPKKRAAPRPRVAEAPV